MTPLWVHPLNCLLISTQHPSALLGQLALSVCIKRWKARKRPTMSMNLCRACVFTVRLRVKITASTLISLDPFVGVWSVIRRLIRLKRCLIDPYIGCSLWQPCLDSPLSLRHPTTTPNNPRLRVPKHNWAQIVSSSTHCHCVSHNHVSPLRTMCSQTVVTLYRASEQNDPRRPSSGTKPVDT